MYISRVAIKNIRSIENLEINFKTKNESSILTGNNGAGKSTILRCIAMGMMDEDSAASVLREMPGELVRKGSTQGRIIIDLIENRNKSYRINTRIVSQESFEKVFQIVGIITKGKYKKTHQAEFPWYKFFSVGYGAGVRNLGTADYQYYVGVDAMYSLFKLDSPLQNPELGFRRIVARARENGNSKSGTDIEKYINSLLKNVLNLHSDAKVKLTSTSIQVSTNEWGSQELSTLGDGYISTITWVLDLFSWWMLHLKQNGKSVLKNKEIKGIVLIDEIEQHLHPIWQIRIMEILQNAFPSVQFITTTHSPLVISGKLNTKVQMIKGGKTIEHNVSGWLAEDVYREILGLDSTRPIQLKLKMTEYKNLHFQELKKSNVPRKKKLKKLKKEIESMLTINDIEIDKQELRNISRFLKS